jgi:hypothetical protein
LALAGPEAAGRERIRFEIESRTDPVRLLVQKLLRFGGADLLAKTITALLKSE